MTYSQAIKTRSTEDGTFSGALLAILGEKERAFQQPVKRAEQVPQSSSSSPTINFELIILPSRTDKFDVLPDVPKKQRFRATIKYVEDMKFSKELFD